MNATIRDIRRHLRKALDRDLAIYERYVPSNKVLIEYVELTRNVLLHVIEDVFNEKIESIKARPNSGQLYPNTLYVVGTHGPDGR